jgi:hypothetical protein
MKTMKNNNQAHIEAGHFKPNVLASEKGSVILVVLMALVTLTVIAIVSSDSQITENQIVRNLGIRKQNVFLLDSALMRGYQEFMQISSDSVSAAANFSPNVGPNAGWINDIHNDPPNPGDPEEFINTIWFEDVFTQRCLFPGNSQVENILPLIGIRGENGNGGLRYAIVGWDAVDLGAGGGSQSLGAGQNDPVWHAGRLIAEYVSVDAAGEANGFGLLRQEMGLRRKWIN